MGLGSADAFGMVLAITQIGENELCFRLSL